MKKKACTEIGIASFGTDFEADVTQEQLIAKIDELNAGTASIMRTAFVFLYNISWWYHFPPL